MMRMFWYKLRNIDNDAKDVDTDRFKAAVRHARRVEDNKDYIMDDKKPCNTLKKSNENSNHT
jgi:hypothetical protein